MVLSLPTTAWVPGVISRGRWCEVHVPGKTSRARSVIPTYVLHVINHAMDKPQSYAWLSKANKKTSIPVLWWTWTGTSLDCDGEITSAEKMRATINMEEMVFFAVECSMLAPSMVAVDNGLEWEIWLHIPYTWHELDWGMSRIQPTLVVKIRSHCFLWSLAIKEE